MTTISEEWARTAPAGPELDRVCAEWMGRRVKTERPAEIEWERCQHRDKFSTDWSAAGPLLEAMNDDLPLWQLCPQGDGSYSMQPFSMASLKYVSESKYLWPKAPDPCLAISRACAVLVARGISREDLG